MRDRKEVTCLELRERARLIKDKVQEVTWARWRGSFRLSWRPLNLISYLSSILLCKGENWCSKSWCNLPRIKQKQLAEPISTLLLHLSPPFPLYAPEYTCSHMLHLQTHTHKITSTSTPLLSVLQNTKLFPTHNCCSLWEEHSSPCSASDQCISRVLVQM